MEIPNRFSFRAVLLPVGKMQSTCLRVRIRGYFVREAVLSDDNAVGSEVMLCALTAVALSTRSVLSDLSHTGRLPITSVIGQLAVWCLRQQWAL